MIFNILFHNFFKDKKEFTVETVIYQLKSKPEKPDTLGLVGFEAPAMISCSLRFAFTPKP